jgi:FlaA1/EpsC-like NDP-sugar epimerase
VLTAAIEEEAVCDLFGGDREAIKVIGIRHGEKMYETLLTNEECANAIDLGNFYRAISVDLIMISISIRVTQPEIH